jgi:hypothetical protein
MQRLLNKVNNISKMFNPDDKILKDYLDTIYENSSAYQLIDMFAGSSEEEICKIISSFIPDV